MVALSPRAPVAGPASHSIDSKSFCASGSGSAELGAGASTRRATTMGSASRNEGIRHLRILGGRCPGWVQGMVEYRQSQAPARERTLQLPRTARGYTSSRQTATLPHSMPLSAGTKLGTYEILAPIGAGGMGEVYRARDSRLGREVAIKVLPRDLADTSEIRARFEREARLISSMNHPNICIVHDVGHEGEDFYLVMELIEGESLADRIARGALPTEDVLRY